LATINDIKRRRDSVKNLEKITKTMHMISSIRFKVAQGEVKHLEEVIDKLKDIFGKIPQENRSFENSPLIIVISSDRGMAGAYNINVLSKAYREVSRIKELKIIALGKKAKDFFDKKELNLSMYYSGIEGEIPQDVLSEIVQRVLTEYENGSKILLAYTHFHSLSKLEPQVITLLPPPLSKMNDLNQYIYEPEPQGLTSKLLEFYIKVSLRGYYHHSYVSEQGARMISMEKATESADELLEELEYRFHQNRKNIITGEIAEIVSGAQDFRN